MAWYAWHWADYERDTLHLTLEQDAIYRRLIDWYYSHQSPIPDNDQAICTIARISMDKWNENSLIIRAFFKPKNNRLHLKLCDAQIADQKLRSEKRIVNARNAAEVRWGKIEHNQEDECDSHAQRNADAMRNDATNIPTNNTYIQKNTGNGFLHSGGLVGEKFIPSLECCDKLLSIAPGWDQHSLLNSYNGWKNKNHMPTAKDPDAAFLGWAKSFTKGRRPN